MANTVETQTIVDGKSMLVVHIHLDSDGTSGELTNEIVVDASTFNPAFTDCRLMSIQSNLVGFTAELIWDGATDKHAAEVPDYEQNQDFTRFGGIPNNAVTPTGDLLITTAGFTTAGDTGHILLVLRKKY